MRHQLIWRVVEAFTTGLAFGALLCWGSTALVGSFSPQGLPEPYWATAPWLRTDTLGIAAFAAAAVCLPLSEYLRLRRRAAIRSRAKRWATGERPNPSRHSVLILVQAVAEALAILSVLLVGYLSVNAVMHPATLLSQATHILSWPSEGTLRVVALLLALGSVSTLRFLWSASPAAFTADHFSPEARLDSQRPN